MARYIPMRLWGKDHWSTLAYIETICVDYKGTIDFRRMRIHEDRHPEYAVNYNRFRISGKSYPTRLKNGALRKSHDDWDCVEDMAREGLIEIEGTGINPLLKLTEKGIEIAHRLREFKIKGGNFTDFRVMRGLV